MRRGSLADKPIPDPDWGEKEVTGNTCFPVRTDVAVGVQRSGPVNGPMMGSHPQRDAQKRPRGLGVQADASRGCVPGRKFSPRGCVVEDFEMAQLAEWRDVDT